MEIGSKSTPGLDVAVRRPVELLDPAYGVRRAALRLEVAVVADSEHVGVVGAGAVLLRHSLATLATVSGGEREPEGRPSHETGLKVKSHSKWKCFYFCGCSRSSLSATQSSTTNENFGFGYPRPVLSVLPV
jgi:hypothetical protein